MFVDYVKIDIKAGDGGNGCTSFYRDKMNPAGGPDGGNGGKGGDVIVCLDKSASSLVNFYYTRKFVAENGQMGMGNNRTGKNGEDIYLKLPLGTVIKDAESGRIVLEVLDDTPVTILTGGAGGRGNSRFATSTRQAPGFSETGEKTKKYSVILELKTIADVGLVGFPNVGKSTILSVISEAKPKIANYHFTTLSPNIGVVKYYDTSFVVADIPGLIEGASEGAGLGHEFLRHIERTRLIVHVIDISESEGRNAIEDYKIINNELTAYSKKLATLPQIIALNKCDILGDNKTKIEEFKKAYPDKIIIPISAITNMDIEVLIKTIHQELSKLPKSEPVPIEEYDFDKRDTISLNIEKLSDGTFEVSGGLIDEILRGIVFENSESMAYFQKRLKNEGIIDKLKEKGAVEGSTIRIGNIEFEYLD